MVKRSQRRSENGSATVDVLVGLLIIAAALAAVASFIHPIGAGTGNFNAQIAISEIERIHARALAQNEVQSVIFKPDSSGSSTTILTITGHDPSATPVDTRNTPGSITSSVQGGLVTSPFMVTALADGTVTIATTTAMSTMTSAPACPVNPTITFASLSYSLDCSAGRLTPI